MRVDDVQLLTHNICKDLTHGGLSATCFTNEEHRLVVTDGLRQEHPQTAHTLGPNSSLLVVPYMLSARHSLRIKIIRIYLDLEDLLDDFLHRDPLILIPNTLGEQHETVRRDFFSGLRVT